MINMDHIYVLTYILEHIKDLKIYKYIYIDKILQIHIQSEIIKIHIHPRPIIMKIKF